MPCFQSGTCMNWQYHEGELDREDVRALLAQHFAEMRAGSPPSACHVLTADALKARVKIVPPAGSVYEKASAASLERNFRLPGIDSAIKEKVVKDPQ